MTLLALYWSIMILSLIHISDIPMEPHGFCLADTGAQYYEGTTDITRTIAPGALTEEEKRIYPLVLRGHLQLGRCV